MSVQSPRLTRRAGQRAKIHRRQSPGLRISPLTSQPRGRRAWAIGSTTKWRWFQERDRSDPAEATARPPRCCSRERGQGCSRPTSTSTRPARRSGSSMKKGGVCEAAAGDVSRAQDVARIVGSCIDAFGCIDVLHNNVGIVEVGGPVEATEESWDRVNDVNLSAPTAVAPMRWCGGAMPSVRWGIWATPGMSLMRLCSSPPTRRNTSRAPSWSWTAG